MMTLSRTFEITPLACSLTPGGKELPTFDREGLRGGIAGRRGHWSSVTSAGAQAWVRRSVTAIAGAGKTTAHHDNIAGGRIGGDAW
jgi:hypothetical protein